MPRVQSRRSFLLGLASIIGLSTSHPTRVFAADSNSSVAFTSDLAQDYALSLLPIVDGSANLEIEQIVPVCQQIGLICGYEISVTREGSPYGYLVLDASYPGLLKEITLGDTILPISASLSNAISTYSGQQATNPTVLISYNDIEYGTLVPGTRDCVTNYNNIRSVPIVTEKGITPQSNNPTSWNAVIINEDDLMLHFQIDDLNGIPFRGVSESLVEARTNKYACVVSALYAVSMHYGLTSSNANQFNPDYYKEIWNVTGTTTYKTNDQGVEYGSTIIPDGIVPFKSLAAQKGRALNTQFFGYQPQFAQYRATIDQGNIGLYHMWINSRNSEGSVELSGHTVTVTGYFTGHNGSSGIELQWLEVFDGWNTYPRAINYATPNMVKLNGTVFW